MNWLKYLDKILNWFYIYLISISFQSYTFFFYLQKLQIPSDMKRHLVYLCAAAPSAGLNLSLHTSQAQKLTSWLNLTESSSETILIWPETRVNISTVNSDRRASWFNPAGECQTDVFLLADEQKSALWGFTF